MNNVLKKIKKSFILKIILSLTLFIFSIIILFSIFFINVRKNTMHDFLVETGGLLTKVLAQGSRIGTFSGSKILLEKELKNIFQHEDLIRASVYDASGNLLSSYARSNRDAKKKPTFSEVKISPERYSELLSKNSHSVDENDDNIEFWAPVFPDSSFDTMNSYYYDTKEITPKELPTGYVSVSMTKDNLKKKISSLIFISILINAILIMAISIIIYSFINHAQIPLEKLIRGIKTIAMGEEPEPIDVTSSDEFGELAKLFNNMSRTLMERERVRKIIKKDMEAALELKNDELFDLNKRLNIDANEHRATLTKLFESKERYKKILSTIEDGYFEMNTNGQFTFFNDLFSTMTDRPGNSLLGQSIFNLSVNYDPKDIEKTVQKVITNKRASILYDFKINNSGRTDKILEIRLFPNVNNDGTINITGFSHDITERFFEIENQKRNDLKQQESNRIKSIRILAGGIAHEYNNLLHTIGLNHCLLTKDLEHHQKHRDYLDSINLCLVKAKKLTNKFLSFGRGGKFDAKPIIMNDILKRTSKMFVESRNDIEIIEKFQIDLHKIEADQNQIEQSVFNILLNAGQAMPAGGKITIETKNVTLDEVFASQYENEAGDYVCCSITDIGTGMTTETMNRMFDPFFTTRDMSEGTGKGLGLASVYGTIKNHKGIITASSTINEGSTFNIFFHAIKEYDPQKRRLPIKTNVEDRKITVLLVDDEPMILEFGKEILESYDFNTHVAENGLEAVNLYKEKTDEIDIIVLDMIMPVMDGSKAYLKLKEINENVVVLLSSGYQLDMKVQAILDQGCNGFIQKPYEMGELNLKIREILGIKDY